MLWDMRGGGWGAVGHATVHEIWIATGQMSEHDDTKLPNSLFDQNMYVHT